MRELNVEERSSEYSCLKRQGIGKLFVPRGYKKRTNESVLAEVSNDLELVPNINRKLM